MTKSTASTNQPSPEEEVLWAGSSSQILNWLWWLLALTVILIPVTLYQWLKVRMTKYVLTSERIMVREGILNFTTSYLELYRVRDVTLHEPFLLRLVGCGNLVMQTSDRSHPQFILPAIRNAAEVQELLRIQVEKMRKTKGVREVDFE